MRRAVLAFALLCLTAPASARQTIGVTFVWDLDASHDQVTSWQVAVNGEVQPCGPASTTPESRQCTITVPTGSHTFRLRALSPEGDWSDLLSASFLAPGAFTIIVAWDSDPQAPPPPPPPPPPGDAIVIGHAEVALFDQVPIDLVSPLRVMSANRSVGWYIGEGLSRCLPAGSESAPVFCRRWTSSDGETSVPPQTWTPHPLPGWRYFSWPGQDPGPGGSTLPCADTSSYTSCFETYLVEHATQWDVVSMQPSYLDAGTFMLSAEDYLSTYERLRARHPSLIILLHTSSLARVLGSANLTNFNGAVRDYVAVNGGILIDIADIESHDPFTGERVLYNGHPAMSHYYTGESQGGHPNSFGILRLAQAWWVALAKTQGWEP